jgi:hypothetical protein
MATIPQKIKDWVKEIREAKKGSEVRESLARSVELTAETSETARVKSEEASEITQSLLDESFDSSKLNMNFEQRLDDEIANLQPDWTQFKDQTNEQLAQKSEDLSSRVINVLYPPAPLIGAKGDGTTNDTEALETIRDFIINNGGVFFVPASARVFLPDGIDLFGVRNLRIEGTMVGNDVSKEVTVGIRSGITLPFKAYFNRITDLKLKIQGVKNGDITINSVPHLLLWADSANPDIDSIAYSNFYLGEVRHLEFNSTGNMAWINENKFFGGRITRLTIDGDYTHNHNHFYNPTLERSTVNIVRGSSNKIYGARFEYENTIAFGSQSWDNEIFRTWHVAPGNFLRGHSRTSFTDNGRNNVVHNHSDAYFDLKNVFSIYNDSSNYNVDNIIRLQNLFEVPSTGRFVNTFETHLISMENDIGVELLSDNALWRMYIEVYDENKERINTQPSGFIETGHMTWSSTSNRFSVSTNLSEIRAALFKRTNVRFIKIYAQPHLAGTFNWLSVNIRHLKASPLHASLLERHTKKTAASRPTTGYFEVGEVVWNVGSNNDIAFWRRLTTGTNHALGADWVAHG